MISGVIAQLIPWDALAWLATGVAGLVALVIGINRKATLRAENKALRADIKSHEVRDEVDNRIARERDARQRLRDKWSE